MNVVGLTIWTNEERLVEDDDRTDRVWHKRINE